MKMSEVLADANIDIAIMRVNKTPICVMQVLYSLNTSVLRNFLFLIEEKYFHILSCCSDPEPSEALCPREP